MNSNRFTILIRKFHNIFLLPAIDRRNTQQQLQQLRFYKINFYRKFIQSTGATVAAILVFARHPKRLPSFAAKIAFTSIVFSSSSATTATHKMSAQNFEDLLRNADQLFDENKFQEVIEVLSNYADQTSCDLKWRKARAMFQASKSDKTKREELIRGGYVLAEEAIKIDDNNFAAHKWMAILLDAKSELEGIKVRVSQLATVKHHMERAIELNPEDPTSWHLLGNFAFGIADMAWYQRKIVSTFFATPPTGTYEEALQHFLTAEEKKPNFYSPNILFIGKCYHALKDSAKAKEYLTKAANVEVLNEDDKKCKEEATELLKKY